MKQFLLQIVVVSSFVLSFCKLSTAEIASVEHSLYNPYGTTQKVEQKTLENFLEALKIGDEQTVYNSLKENPTLALYRFNLGEKIGNGLTAVGVAVIYGHINVVKTLLKLRNASEQLVSNDIAEDTRGNTPFKLAVMNNASNQMLNLLLSRGSDINTLNNENETPLMYAAREGNLRIVIFLLQSPQIDVLQINKNGKTAQQLAAENNHEEIEKLIKKAEGNIESLMDVLTQYIYNQLDA